MSMVLLVKDILGIQTLISCKAQVVDNATNVCNHCQSNPGICCEGIWVTGIICVTLLIITLVIVGLILYLKKKNILDKVDERDKKIEAERERMLHQLNIEQEKEKARYRERLANFLELHANKKTNEHDDYIVDAELCDSYVIELKSYIKDLKPSDNEVHFSTKSTDAL